MMLKLLMKRILALKLRHLTLTIQSMGLLVMSLREMFALLTLVILDVMVKIKTKQKNSLKRLKMRVF
nr:hypothetical protein [Methanotorris formicicus]